MLNVYGRSLWFFLRHRWISVVIWVICLVGTAYFFYVIPKAFLPVGDSSFIRGVMVAQEGSSPAQMHAYQSQAEKMLQANPAVRQHVHHERQQPRSWLRIRACLLAFLKTSIAAAAHCMLWPDN